MNIYSDNYILKSMRNVFLRSHLLSLSVSTKKETTNFIYLSFLTIFLDRITANSIKIIYTNI